MSQGFIVKRDGNTIKINYGGSFNSAVEAQQVYQNMQDAIRGNGIQVTKITGGLVENSIGVIITGTINTSELDLFKFQGTLETIVTEPKLSLPAANSDSLLEKYGLVSSGPSGQVIDNLMKVKDLAILITNENVLALANNKDSLYSPFVRAKYDRAFNNHNSALVMTLSSYLKNGLQEMLDDGNAVLTEFILAQAEHSKRRIGNEEAQIGTIYFIAGAVSQYKLMKRCLGGGSPLITEENIINYTTKECGYKTEGKPLKLGDNGKDGCYDATVNDPLGLRALRANDSLNRSSKLTADYIAKEVALFDMDHPDVAPRANAYSGSLLIYRLFQEAIQL